MTGQDITIDVFKKSGLLKVAMGCLIGYVICIFVMAGDFFYFYNRGEFGDSNPISIIILGFASVCAIMLFMFMAIYGIMGLRGKSAYSKFINEVGEDQFMREINNDTLYVFAKKDRPVTIVTRNHIFEVGRGIFSSTGIDIAYGYSYKGATSIRAYTIQDKAMSFANGVNLRGDDKAKIFAALLAVNPDILLGFTGDNLKEHRNRVKEYKKSLKADRL